MPVIVNEIDNVPPPAQALPAGGGNDGGGATAAISAQQLAQIGAAMRRDVARLARLWAD